MQLAFERLREMERKGEAPMVSVKNDFDYNQNIRNSLVCESTYVAIVIFV